MDVFVQRFDDDAGYLLAVHLGSGVSQFIARGGDGCGKEQCERSE